MHDFLKSLPEMLAVYDRALAYTEDLWRDLDPDEVVWRRHWNSSAIGWHRGHQAHVARFMLRNFTAAEPSRDAALDRIMDSANPEQSRGTLPTIRPAPDLLQHRRRTRPRPHRHDRPGRVKAHDELAMIAGTMLIAITTTSTHMISGSPRSVHRASVTSCPPPPTATLRAGSTAI